MFAIIFHIIHLNKFLKKKRRGKKKDMVIIIIIIIIIIIFHLSYIHLKYL